MEIEAKFAIPNRQVYRDFLRVRQLAGFTLVPTGAVNVTDQYVDTADARLLQAGYACRLRTAGTDIVVSLKGLGGAEGAIHHRDEQEVRLPGLTLDIHAWPASPARNLALRLAGDAALQPLFDLEQHRVRADVVEASPGGARRVAQFSLDAVRAAVGRRPAFYYELEVELQDDGTDADLARIAAELAETYQLAPESRSKFERGLAALRSRGAAVEGRLSPAEQDALQGWMDHADPELARRAAVVLAWAEGLPTRDIVARSGLSAGRVRFWLRAFRERRMAVFEEDEGRGSKDEGGPETQDQQPATDAGRRKTTRRATNGQPAQARRGRAVRDETQAQAAPPPESPRPPDKRQGLPTVLAFCRLHHVDLAHARQVAALTDRLFMLLRSRHRLPRKRRKLLKQAALLVTVGAQTDPERPHRAGRDLILAQPFHRVPTADRLLLACIVAFQGRKVKPEKEPTMAALEPKQRDQVLRLAALLRMAEALDFSRSQTTEITGVEDADAASCAIQLAGPSAEVDALQATERGDLWRRLFDQELLFEAAGSALAAEAAGQLVPANPTPTTAPAPPAQGPVVEELIAGQPEPLLPDEPMSEAGRKLLRLHFGRMLANEAGTRAGEDIEALHDMRVATRRMRAAYGIFAEYFDSAVLDPFNKGLRRTGRSLGAVRDLDVLLEKAEAYRAALLPEAAGAGDIGPLLDDWHARRAVARRQMLEYLDGQSYRTFVADFRTFLTTPGAGALAYAAEQPVPYRVRHVVPRLILTRYEAVRAYEPVIADAPLPTYHLLRIDCKRLRYALEFFRDVLGPEAPGLIKQVTALQDLLGALQDAHVAEGLIAEFLRAQPRRKKKTPAISLAGVEQYLAAQRAAQEDLLALFPPAWSEVTGPDFRRALALAVSVL